MKKMFAALVLGLTSTVSAYASNWHYAAVGNDDTKYFFDAETIEKTKDRTMLLWVKTVQTKKHDSDNSWSSSYRWKLNCTKRTIQTMMWSTYDQDAKFIRSNGNPSSETLVLPDSTGEAMLKIACEPSFPNDKSGRKYFKLDNNDPFLSTRNLVSHENSQVDQAPK